jgi:hypothetical protein
MLLLCFIIILSGDTLYHGVKVTSVCIMCIFLVNVSMKCWYLLEPSSAFTVIVWDNLVWVHPDFEECFVALCMISVHFPLENCFELHIDDSIYWFNYVIFVGSVSTSESSKLCTPFPFSFVTCLLAAILILDYSYHS